MIFFITLVKSTQLNKAQPRCSQSTGKAASLEMLWLMRLIRGVPGCWWGRLCPVIWEFLLMNPVFGQPCPTLPLGPRQRIKEHAKPIGPQSPWRFCQLGHMPNGYGLCLDPLRTNSRDKVVLRGSFIFLNCFQLCEGVFKQMRDDIIIKMTLRTWNYTSCYLNVAQLRICCRQDFYSRIWCSLYI